MNGGWSKWEPWTECDVDCGAGKQTSRRYCTNPFPIGGGKGCEGDDERSRVCEKGPCPGNQYHSYKKLKLRN